MHIDMESNPDVARTQTERAINEGAQCIVGAFDSAGTLAIAQVCEQRQVPLIVNIGAAPQLTEQGYKFLVRNFPTGGMLVSNGLKQIKALIDATKIAPKTAVFLHANDNFGMAQRQGMDKLFPTAGLPFKLLEFDPLRSQGAGSLGRSHQDSRSQSGSAAGGDARRRCHQAGARHRSAEIPADGHHLARRSRPLRRGILQGARAAGRLPHRRHSVGQSEVKGHPGAGSRLQEGSSRTSASRWNASTSASPSTRC